LKTVKIMAVVSNQSWEYADWPKFGSLKSPQGSIPMNRVALYPVLLKQWKYAVLASLAVGAIIAPSPDVKAMGIYAAPILALYGLSVGVAWLVQRNTSA
jgi:hypothetical protein